MSEPTNTSWLTPDVLEEVLLGACILGVGGGGPLVVGQSLLQSVSCKTRYSTCQTM
jgi:DUF917 family protein